MLDRHAWRRLAVVKLCLAWLITTLAAVPDVPAATFATVAPGVISLKGRIELGDCQRWTQALGGDVKTVLLDSIGGRDGQGQCISRSIAERHLRTVVVEKCASICFLLFAAGAEKASSAKAVASGCIGPRSADTDRGIVRSQIPRQDLGLRTALSCPRGHSDQARRARQVARSTMLTDADLAADGRQGLQLIPT